MTTVPSLGAGASELEAAGDGAELEDAAPDELLASPPPDPHAAISRAVAAMGTAIRALARPRLVRTLMEHSFLVIG